MCLVKIIVARLNRRHLSPALGAALLIMIADVILRRLSGSFPAVSIGRKTVSIGRKIAGSGTYYKMMK